MEFISDKENIVGFVKSQVEMLFIDFDDTLVDYQQCQDQALKLLMGDYGISNSDYPKIFELYHNINNQLWPELEKGNKTIPEIREERFEILKQSIPFHEKARKLDNKYLEYFILSTKITNSNFELLKALKNLGYKIVITTNGIREVQRKRIKLIGVDRLVDSVITSEDVGKAKPSPKMYNISLQNYNLSNNQAFVIGDSLSSDILGANNAKIPCCWLNYNLPYEPFVNNPKPDIVCKEFETISSFIIKLKLS
ncbi:MAG: YjjG family noncanonical pyrimidine nucleotidase [Candidatus Kariarchaeaceae archaeon]|jgi:YjjG family noncanonical pyrimidine nucleotidase